MLESTQAAYFRIEERFKHRAVWFIGSESYDAATITVLQGLQMLDFKVYTLNKPNINSWFVNTVVEKPPTEVDFTLSNLHWGTRWSYYRQYAPPRPWVLIDGDDEYWGKGWRHKYSTYMGRYKTNAPKTVKEAQLCPYRWVEPLGDYEPDALFVSQKQQRQEAHYLPFGITQEYIDAARRCWPTTDFLHIPGAGKGRQAVHDLITTGQIPGVAFSHFVRGDRAFPSGVCALAQGDHNRHSYHRWSISQKYFDALSASWALIYPNINGPQWDSKRPYEALMCGCLLIVKQPPTDMSSYPWVEEILGESLIYRDEEDLVQKCHDLYDDAEIRTVLARRVYGNAMRYLTPMPLARYFLGRIHDSRL